MKKLPRVLMKIGGAALVEAQALSYATEAIKQYRLDGYQVIVVHGGGPAINAELTLRGITWQFLNGQRVTTPDMMGVIESTLCGQVNAKLVRHFVSSGVPAVGLSGADNRTLLCKSASSELGLVGAIQQVNSLWIEELLRLTSYPVPVIAPIGVGMDGQPYNINADWAASRLATALQVDQLIYLTDQVGVLNADGVPYTSLCESEIVGLIESGVVTGGMMTKMKSVLNALDGGVGAVRVMSAKDATFACHGEWFGTTCTKESLVKAASGAEELSYATV